MATPYIFETIQIHLFDMNILPGLLTSPKKTISNPDFVLLADKAEYEKFQESDEILKTEHFVCQGFPKKLLRKSSLWTRYGAESADHLVPYWDLQIPLYIRFRKHELEILAIPENDRPRVKADSYLMLNALGWSTHINVTVDLPLKPSQVSDLCNNLRDKAYGPPAYRLNGIEMTLKELLTHYRQMLFLDILSSDTKYSRPGHIPHLIFVDVIRASGKPTRYQDIPINYLEQLARIIKRNNVVIRPVIKDGRVISTIEDMLVTKIDPHFYNFSLTDFDQGSFTFLQTEVFKEKDSGKIFCFSNNTRDCFWVSYFWYESYSRMNDINKKIVKDLFKSGKNALKYLQKNYTSRTSQRLFQNHKGIKKLLPDQTSVDTEKDDIDGYVY